MSKIKSEETTDYQPESSGKHITRRFACSRDIFEFLQDTNLDYTFQEQFIAIALNNKNEPLAYELVSKGSVSETQVEAAAVMRFVISQPGVARFVLAHNHPSNDCTPSPEDVALTERLAECGKLFGIPVLDHIIISGSRGFYLSLRDRGLFNV